MGHKYVAGNDLGILSVVISTRTPNMFIGKKVSFLGHIAFF